MSEDANPTSPLPPRRDKFAALAQQQQQAHSTSSSTETALPRPSQRDKFAAMAMAVHSHNNTTTASTGDVPTESSTGSNPLIPPLAQRRDKLAAMSQHQHQSPIPPDELVSSTAVDSYASNMEQLERRCQLRNNVWEDLTKAEALCLALLETAEVTASTLAQQTTAAPIQPELVSELAKRYQDQLSDLHGLLSQHAHLVQAYQPSESINRMYLTRVELRLAATYRELLQDIIDDEISTTTTAAEGVMTGRKRPLEADPTS